MFSKRDFSALKLLNHQDYYACKRITELKGILWMRHFTKIRLSTINHVVS